MTVRKLINQPVEPRFSLGTTVATTSILESLSGREILMALGRHVAGDWGEVDTEDKQANDRALIEGTRLMSIYRSETGTKFWVITEADRSSTTILFPGDY